MSDEDGVLSPGFLEEGTILSQPDHPDTVPAGDVHPAIDEYLASVESPKLHLGAGPVLLPGWLNTDLEPSHPAIVRLDAAEPLPFADASLDRIFAEHLIEHLDYRPGLSFLRESRRVLRAGGIIRLATPDLRQISRLMLDDLDETQEAYVRLINGWFGQDPESTDPTFAVNSSFYGHGHRFLYTAEVLRASLEVAGFESIEFNQPLVSRHQDLVGLETHGRILGDERLNTYECMVLEATVPFQD